MRQTGAAAVVRLHPQLKVSDAAEFFVAALFPHLRDEDYEWTLMSEHGELPGYFTFAATRVRSGDTLSLIGNNRRPSWRPSYR